MAVLAAAGADVGCRHFSRSQTSKLVPRLFLITSEVYNAIENPFIIRGSTVQAGNFCDNIFLPQRIEYGGDCYISLSFQFAHGAPMDLPVDGVFCSSSHCLRLRGRAREHPATNLR